jgi:hypothetical protein
MKEYMKSLMIGENVIQSFKILDVSAFCQVLGSQLIVNLQINFSIFSKVKEYSKSL